MQHAKTSTLQSQKHHLKVVVLSVSTTRWHCVTDGVPSYPIQQPEHGPGSLNINYLKPTVEHHDLKCHLNSELIERLRFAVRSLILSFQELHWLRNKTLDCESFTVMHFPEE